MMLFRELIWPADEQALRELDTSFPVERAYCLDIVERTATLTEAPIHTPLRKSYPLAEQLDEIPSFDWVRVAVDDDAIVALAAVSFARWNRRAELRHLYVAPNLRRRGVGARLLIEAADAARRLGARVLLVETQTTNTAAVRFYERHGLKWCGFDASLYDPNRVMPGEVALFYALDLCDGVSVQESELSPRPTS